MLQILCDIEHGM